MDGSDSWEQTIARLIAEAEAASDRDVRVDCLQRAALIFEGQVGDGEKAYAVWQAAFHEDFANERSALALERLARDLGTGLELAAEAESLLGQVSDRRQRAALLVWSARWLLGFAGDRGGAEAHLLEALRLDPESRSAAEGLRHLNAQATEGMAPTPPPVLMEEPVMSGVGGNEAAADPLNLHQRLDGLAQAGRWVEAVDVLKVLAAGEGGELRAKYLATAGKILHHKLGNDDAAIDLLNRALDAHANDLKTFERLYQILAGRRDWRGVEANLLRMIERFTQAEAVPGTLEALWRRLADVYRVGIKDLAAATSAYKVCARLAPHEPRYPQILAQLAERQR